MWVVEVIFLKAVQMHWDEGEEFIWKHWIWWSCHLQVSMPSPHYSNGHMIQAWPIMICYPQGHDNSPDGLVPRPEPAGASPMILCEHGDGKHSFSTRVAELGLCKPGSICDPTLFLLPLPSAQVSHTRPTGQIQPSTLFYLSSHLVSTWQQCWALT